MSFSVGAPARLQVEARRRFKGTMLNTKRRPIKVRAPRRRRERPGSPQRLRANAAWRSAFRLAAALGARLASPALRRGGAVPWARALPRCGAGLRQRGALRAALTLAGQNAQPGVAAPRAGGQCDRLAGRCDSEAARRAARRAAASAPRARPAGDRRQD